MANLGDAQGALRSYRKARDLAVALAARAPSWESIEALTEAHLRISNMLAVEAPDDARTAAEAALAEAAGWYSRESGTARSRVLLARAHFSMALTADGAEKLPHSPPVRAPEPERHGTSSRRCPWRPSCSIEVRPT